MIVLYILLAILVFGIMIFVHELGHFAFAKIFKVSINEFSIGMGPKIISKKGKDGVLYALRLFPIGGFVSMAGESEESDDPNAYDKKPAYQRFIIVIAGAVMNIVIAVIVVFFLSLTSPLFGTTTVAEFDNGEQVNQGLTVGDKIIEVDGNRVATYDELSYEIMMNGDAPVDILVIRNNERVLIEDYIFPTTDEDGITYGQMNFYVMPEKRTFGSVMKNTFHTSVSTVKMIWDSIIGLITGKFGFKQLSGPVGVTGAMVEVAQYGPRSFFYMVAVISMNLGVFNLLPIPALDGGTLLFTGIEMIFKKKVPRKVEDIVKIVGFVLLISLVVIVSIKDIISLIIF
ncbi:MAG: site-2 protease family protein [Clostridia bacterium]|nr:site-2 protease family protein [Clostridia bacterium]